MAESEKTVALKKAYADIILNTAKEAAARIMVSERKAVRFEKDLSSTRDEALRLLVHLKHMIDSTTKEAVVASSTKQRKIDELEAQLNEAEDVITDLRSELRWVRDKLAKVKSNSLQPLNGQNTKENARSYENLKVEPIIPSIWNSHVEAVTASDMENSPLSFRIMDNRCCSTAQQTDNLSVSHSEPDDLTSNLASTIMGSKEPEPHRNGCSQRLNGKLPQLGDEGGQCTPVDNDSVIETTNKAVGKCPIPSPKIKNIDIPKKFYGEELKKPIKVRTSRRRKTHFWKAKASPSSKAANKDNVKICSDLDEKLQQKRSFSEDGIKFCQKGKENVRVQSMDATATSLMSSPAMKPCQPSSVVNRSVIYSFSMCGNVKSGEDELRTTDNEAKMKSLLRLDPGLTLITSGMDPVSGSKNVTVSVKALNKCGLVQKTEERDTGCRSESALVKPDGEAVENSMVVCSELGYKMVTVPVLSETKDSKSSIETDGSPTKPDFNRVLKYTFQRKRKKESMSNSGENTSPDKTIVKRRAAEKQNDSQEPEKCTLINESSRDSRRMAQVARQLISLSGRKW